MTLFRVFPLLSGAAPTEDGGALHVARALQGPGRHDNPDRYGALYVSRVPDAAVAERLVRAHYRVHPQWKVGAYRIDLVVEGAGGRLAVECDSDRWHGPEAFERDLVRQRMLERCGLPFSRVRGAAFYRDPDSALEPLWADLHQHDIVPAPALSPLAVT